MDENHGYFVDSPWTWRERLGFKLFPLSHVRRQRRRPRGLIASVVTTIVHLSVRARLMSLISGRIKVETRTVTENIVGGTATSSVAYPVWR